MNLRKIGSVAVIAIIFSMGAEVFGQDAKPPGNSVELKYPPTITVAGRGEVFATPDRAIVRLGVQEQAETAAAAQASVNEAMTKALDQLKKMGISERSIRTSGLNLFPIYSTQRPGEEGEDPRVAGYRAANTVQITLDDLTLVGKAIDAGITAGVNRLEGVNFELRDDLPQRSEALQHAIEQAMTKAKVMAPALDVKLGKLREVIEGGIAVEPPQPLFGREMRAAFAVTDTPVQPGEIRVEASVTLRYEIVQ